MKQALAISLAMLQLVLVALGALEIELPNLGGLSKVLNIYGSATGANYSYGFFAPGIDGQLRARFQLGTGKNARIVSLDTPSTHESALRVGNIIDQFWEPDDSDGEEVHHALLASLAGKMLSRHPEAKVISVKLERFDPVSMQQYLQGERPQWEEFYEATYRYQHSN